MSKGINKVILVGNVGSPPDVRVLKGGEKVVKVSVATTETWKDKESGEKKSITEWHSIAIFGKLADIAEKYIVKGDKIYIEGALKARKWIDKDTDVEKKSIEIIAQQLQVLSARKETGNKSSVDLFDDEIPF